MHLVVDRPANRIDYRIFQCVGHLLLRRSAAKIRDELRGESRTESRDQFRQHGQGPIEMIHLPGVCC